MNKMQGAPLIGAAPARVIRPQRCETCRHSTPLPDRGGAPAEQVECRESPPAATVFIVNQGTAQQGFITHTGFPMPHRDHWCSRWKIKVEKAS